MPTQVTNYQCPACTGPLHYSAKSGKLACDYCGSSFDVAEIEALYARKEAEAAAAKQAADAKAEAAQAAKAEAAEAAAASGGCASTAARRAARSSSATRAPRPRPAPTAATRRSCRGSFRARCGRTISSRFA